MSLNSLHLPVANRVLFLNNEKPISSRLRSKLSTAIAPWQAHLDARNAGSTNRGRDHHEPSALGIVCRHSYRVYSVRGSSRPELQE